MCEVCINVVGAVYFRKDDSCRIVRAYVTVAIQAEIALRAGDITGEALNLRISGGF